MQLKAYWQNHCNPTPYTFGTVRLEASGRELPATGLLWRSREPRLLLALLSQTWKRLSFRVRVKLILLMIKTREEQTLGPQWPNWIARSTNRKKCTNFSLKKLLKSNFPISTYRICGKWTKLNYTRLLKFLNCLWVGPTISYIINN